MTFQDVLAQAIDWLQRDKRISYRALKRQFDLDDAYLEDLTLELIEIQEVAVDQDGRMLVWTGESGTQPEPGSTSQPAQTSEQPPAQQDQSTQAAPPPPEPPAPDAERRQLTILFTDLVDSTKLSSELDAEDYREIVRAYQAACAEVIARFDCHLAQTLGDGLLIYSGYPVAHDNDAERAVRAGLGILDAMQTLNEHMEQEKGIRLGVRVGIHTGPVVVGEVGTGARHEQLALGEVPNVAARIQGLAEPDTVVISTATYRLIQGYFDCGTLGEHALRGVAEPIAVYRVLSESAAQGRLDIASARGLTPLVGREQEVGLLLERWNQVKDGQGQVALLSGEAGIGKSRLVRVLKDHVTEGPHTRWECRSSPYYQNTALYPLIDLIQRTLQWHQDDTPAQRLEKLEQALRQYRLRLDESVPLFATLLSLPIPDDRYPPLVFSPQQQRQKTLETIVAILLELAEQQPLLFILEDLHWTDPTTLALLELLIDHTPTAAICVLLTCRPAFQPLWSSRSYLTQMTINRLSLNQSEQMAERVAGGKRLPGDVLQQIIEKTDGVPLFVEEMSKAVLESGTLKGAHGQYTLTGPLTSLTIPTTLQDSLMARLDRLVTAKVVAQYAAVIGRQFSYELLQAVSQMDEATLQRELGRLVAAELVYQRGLSPQATYLFKHALVVDAAYHSLLKSTRQQYHQRIADVLAERFPETAEHQPELLAYHYQHSGNVEKAITYLQQAGQGAARRAAYDDAIAHLTTALELLATLPGTPKRLQQELTLHIALGTPLMAARGYAAPEVEHAFVRAYELCQQLGEPRQLVSVLQRGWTMYLNKGSLSTAQELAEALLTLAQRHQESRFLLGARLALGVTLVSRGEYSQAQEHLRDGIALYDSRQHHSQRALQDAKVTCLAYLAWAQWYLGYTVQARQTMQEALALARSLSHPATLAAVIYYASRLSISFYEVQTVHELTEEGIAICTEHGMLYFLAAHRSLQGWALAMQGRELEGIAQIRQGLEACRVQGVRLPVPVILALLAEAHARMGQVDAALVRLDEALELTEAGTYSYTHGAELHRLQGALLLQQSTPEVSRAETSFQQAIDIAHYQQAKSWELRAAASLARLWQSQDKRQDAYDLLAPVYGWFTEGFDTADLQDAKALLDELTEGSS